MILNSILEKIGNTPLISLQKIGKVLSCQLVAKCEFFNPSGSIKDRIALNMIEDAERSGRIKPGDTLIEASSGNAGIGFALVSAIKGYRVIIATMPEKMSREKKVVLEALGASIHYASGASNAYILLADQLQREIPNSHILNQYKNPENPGAHYKYTAKEILAEGGDQLKMVVMGVGTGGTITGIARGIKEAKPHVKIIGVDPFGSRLSGRTDEYPYLVEGIGNDFVADVLDQSVIDAYVTVKDHDSFAMAKRLIAEEGLLVGGSSGAAVHGALEAAAELQKDDMCVVILPDGIRNYMSKFLDKKWLEENVE